MWFDTREVENITRIIRLALEKDSLEWGKILLIERDILCLVLVSIPLLAILKICQQPLSWRLACKVALLVAQDRGYEKWLPNSKLLLAIDIFATSEWFPEARERERDNSFPSSVTFSLQTNFFKNFLFKKHSWQHLATQKSQSTLMDLSFATSCCPWLSLLLLATTWPQSATFEAQCLRPQCKRRKESTSERALCWTGHADYLVTRKFCTFTFRPFSLEREAARRQQ